MISNITRFKTKIEAVSDKVGTHGASILALISYWSTFYLCALPAFSNALLLHSFCSWPQWKKKHHVRSRPQPVQNLYTEIHSKRFSKQKGKNLQKQQKFNALKNHPKICSITDPFEQNTDGIFVKPPPRYTRVKTLLALRFATSRVNPMSSFSRAIMRLDLQIGAATSSGDDCWGSGTCPAQKSIPSVICTVVSF